jgi:hypothetical protein
MLARVFARKAQGWTSKQHAQKAREAETARAREAAADAQSQRVASLQGVLKVNACCQVQVVVEEAGDNHLSYGITPAEVRRFCSEFGFPFYGNPDNGERDNYESNQVQARRGVVDR